MLVKDGDKMIVGPLDIVCVLHDVTTDRYHAAFFEEAPMPGPIANVEDLTFVRLKSKMHHTEGAATLEEALVHLEETLIAKMWISEENICREPIDWSGDLGIVWIVPNWHRLNAGPLSRALVSI